MKILSAVSTLPDLDQAADAALHEIRSGLSDISYLMVFSTVGYDIDALNALLTRECADAKIHGGTTCRGVMNGRGFFSDDGRALGIWAVSDPDGAYGVGCAGLGDDPRKAAAAAAVMAMENAQRPGEVPKLIFMTTVPGAEEDAIKGIQDAVGADVLIAGGSSADNTNEGLWKQFGHGRVFDRGIVVSALYPSVTIEVGATFSSGYMPAAKTGIVTRVDKRTLYEIDGRPAAQVYNEWTGGAVESALAEGGSVLASTTLFPLGREVGRKGGVPYFMLTHPESVTKDGAINMFTEMNTGDTIELMSGSLESLYTRAGRVAGFLLEDELLIRETAGALVVYCAGCMLAVGDNMHRVADNLNENLAGAPFMGIFTLGEQGCFSNGESHHGNLMISVIIFGRK